MKNISGLLARFQNLTPPNDAVRKAIVKTLFEVAGVKVRKEDITLQRGVAFIKCSSVVKSVIRAARAGILEELVRALPTARDAVRDIR